MRRVEIREGTKYGQLILKERLSGYDRPSALFLCTCGQEHVARISLVVCGRIKSCGCSKKTAKITHGEAQHGNVSSEYSTLRHMIARCHNEKNKAYKDYGGRGIAVCEEWRKDYSAFLRDMGRRPEGCTIDRIDNTLGYFKENCRWVTREVQNKNRRHVIWITRDGETKTLAEWVKTLQLSMTTAWKRYKATGDADWALTKVIKG